MTLELKKAPEALSLAPLCKIKELLDDRLGKDQWHDFEIELISLELNVEFDPLLVDKITVIQALVEDPSLFYVDPLFFLYSVDVINNDIAEFSSVPLPTSLEVAYAIHEIGSIFPGEFKNPVKRTVTFILREEGYSKAPECLRKVTFEDELKPGQTEEDMSNKEKAIKLYIKGMEHGGTISN